MPSLSRPRPIGTAQALILQSLSLEKLSRSRGFQAEPSRHITTPTVSATPTTSRALSQTRSPRSPEITASYLALISSSGGLELGRRTCGWFRRFLPFFEEIQDV